MCHGGGMKHSPGPWACDGGFVVDSDGRTLLDSEHSDVSWEQTKADLRLASLAPDMLELLRKVANLDVERGGACFDLAEEASDLLARIEGGE